MSGGTTGYGATAVELKVALAAGWTLQNLSRNRQLSGLF